MPEDSTERLNPLDIAEQVVKKRGWDSERDDDEGALSFVAEGAWIDFRSRYQWLPKLEEFSISVGFELRLPDAPLREKVRQLIGHINEHLPAGAFNWWEQTGFMMYHYVLQLAGGAHASPEQCEEMLTRAFDACERYYPAFQYVLWAGKSAEDAFALASFDTKGGKQ